MGLNYLVGIPALVVLVLFGVYLSGRMFVLGFAKSLKQQANTKETTRGTRQ